MTQNALLDRIFERSWEDLKKGLLLEFSFVCIIFALTWRFPLQPLIVCYVGVIVFVLLLYNIQIKTLNRWKEWTRGAWTHPASVFYGPSVERAIQDLDKPAMICGMTLPLSRYTWILLANIPSTAAAFSTAMIIGQSFHTQIDEERFAKGWEVLFPPASWMGFPLFFLGLKVFSYLFRTGYISVVLYKCNADLRVLHLGVDVKPFVYCLQHQKHAADVGNLLVIGDVLRIMHVRIDEFDNHPPGTAESRWMRFATRTLLGDCLNLWMKITMIGVTQNLSRKELVNILVAIALTYYSLCCALYAQWRFSKLFCGSGDTQLAGACGLYEWLKFIVVVLVSLTCAVRLLGAASCPSMYYNIFGGCVS